MNYIKKLEQENKRIEAAEQAIINFRGFLFSEKFHKDPYILNRDVDSIMMEILNILRGMNDEYIN